MISSQEQRYFPLGGLLPGVPILPHPFGRGLQPVQHPLFAPLDVPELGLEQVGVCRNSCITCYWSFFADATSQEPDFLHPFGNWLWPFSVLRLYSLLPKNLPLKENTPEGFGSCLLPSSLLRLCILTHKESAAQGHCTKMLCWRRQQSAGETFGEVKPMASDFCEETPVVWSSQASFSVLCVPVYSLHSFNIRTMVIYYVIIILSLCCVTFTAGWTPGSDWWFPCQP